MRSKPLQLLFASLIFASIAQAQATRTWVSGVGDDANPCSRTAPCKTFAGAYSKTAAGGEIDALDPGGFGAVTISKSLTIDGGGGQVASVLVASGQNGIVVVAGASDVVTLRNLRVTGVGQYSSPGLNGIRYLSGKTLNLENDSIFGFSNHGVDVAGNGAAQTLQLTMTDVNISNVAQNGLNIAPNGGATSKASLTRVNIKGNYPSGNDGIYAGDQSSVALNETFIANEGSSALETAAYSQVAADNSQFVNNNVGVTAGGNGFVLLSQCLVVRNVTNGLVIGGSTAIYSLGNNRINVNGGNNGTGVTLLGLK